MVVALHTCTSEVICDFLTYYSALCLAKVRDRAWATAMSRSNIFFSNSLCRIAGEASPLTNQSRINWFRYCLAETALKQMSCERCLSTWKYSSIDSPACCFLVESTCLTNASFLDFTYTCSPSKCCIMFSYVVKSANRKPPVTRS